MLFSGCAMRPQEIYRDGDFFEEEEDIVCDETTLYVAQPEDISHTSHNAAITFTDAHTLFFGFNHILFADEMGAFTTLAGNNVGFEFSRIGRCGSILPLYDPAGLTLRWPNLAFDAEKLHFFMPMIYTDENGNMTQKIVRMRTFFEHRNVYFTGQDLHYFRQYFGHTPEIIRDLGHLGYTNIFTTDDGLILFEIVNVEGYLRYVITHLNLDTNEEHVLLEKTYSNVVGEGYAISDIFVCGRYVFSYVMEIEDFSTVMRFIKKHDMHGNLIASYILDVETFLFMEEVGDIDSVEGIFKLEDFIVLTTRHHRAIVLKMYYSELIETDGELVEVDTPAIFRQMFRARLLGAHHRNVDAIYFWDSYSTIYALSSAGTISAIEIESGVSETRASASSPRITNIYNDGAGGLLVRVSVADNPDDEHPPPPGTSFFYKIPADEIKVHISCE